MQKRIIHLLVMLLITSIPGWAQTGSGDKSEADGGTVFKKGSRQALAPYRPITGWERARWAVSSTVGPESLAAGVLSASVGTGVNSPKEYGSTWGGFGQRYGIRLTGISTGNAMEAGLGAIWGEDPRYERLPEATFGARVRNVVKFTFVARRHDGHAGPAYARYMAIAGNNMLSDSWRVQSEADAPSTALRTLWGMLARMGANAFAEFWPDARNRLANIR